MLPVSMQESRRLYFHCKQGAILPSPTAYQVIYLFELTLVPFTLLFIRNILRWLIKIYVYVFFFLSQMPVKLLLDSRRHSQQNPFFFFACFAFVAFKVEPVGICCAFPIVVDWFRCDMTAVDLMYTFKLCLFYRYVIRVCLQTKKKGRRREKKDKIMGPNVYRCTQ